VAVVPGETVAILGAGGPISLMFIQLLRRAGAGDVIAVGHSRRRLEVARALGATQILNAREEDTLTAIQELTHGFGADVVLECAGTKSTWETAVEVARRGGRILWFGGLPGGTKVELDAARVHYGEIDLLNMHGGTTQDAREAFDLITSDEINLAPLLNGELPLEQVETALNLMIAGEVVKVLINPDL
jgi:L-iditol 2-dehydrogenase